MRRIFILAQSDIKNIMRDKSLYFVLFVPVIFVVLINFGLPLVFEYFPIVRLYDASIMGFSCLLTAIFPAYVMSFVTLDEKDQEIIPVLRILPFSFAHFIFYRLVFLALIGFIFVFLTLMFTHLIQPTTFQLISLSITCALVTPLVYLSVVLLAKNKIEGVTYFKLINTCFILPLIAFFIDSPIAKITAIIPVFWTFLAFHSISAQSFYPAIFLSIALHGILILFLFKKCMSRL